MGKKLLIAAGTAAAIAAPAVVFTGLGLTAAGPVAGGAFASA